MQAEIEVDPGARAGMLVFYDHRLYCGLTVGDHEIQSHKYGEERGKGSNSFGRRLFLRMRNEDHVVSFHLSRDGREWTPYASSFEASGYHHNVRGGFLALRPALYAAGTGTVRLRDFRYQAL